MASVAQREAPEHPFPWMGAIGSSTRFLTGCNALNDLLARLGVSAGREWATREEYTDAAALIEAAETHGPQPTTQWNGSSSPSTTSTG